MTDDRYDKVTFRGVTVDKYTRAALLEVEKELGYELTLWQGSYHPGVAKSSHTHDGGGVVDLAGNYDATNKVKALRRNGFVADLRNQPSLSGEIHAVQIGNAKADPTAKAQIAPMERGRAGLAVDVPQVIKYTPPGGYKAFVYKSLALRAGTFNLPAEDKLPNPAERLARAVDLVHSANLAIVGWNELQPIKSTGLASDFGHDLDAALGTDWGIVKPALPFNENYISYDGSKLSLVHHYPDTILPAPSGGRHITRAVFKDNTSGVLFAWGQTQLVNDTAGDSATTKATHERDRKAQGVTAEKAMRDVAAHHDNCPIIVAGDFNTSAKLPAFAKWKRTREYADTSKTRDADTYTNYAKTVPGTSPVWVIDQIEVTPDLYVIGYTVVLDTDATGKFKQPRPSDHSLTIVSLKLA